MPAQAYQALVLGTRDYVRKNGFKGALLGLSGGIDSALVLAVAVDALGAQNVDALVAAIAGTPDDAKAAAEKAGLLVVRDDAALDGWIDQAIAANEQAAADVRAGKMAAIGRIVGAAMKLSAGKGDAKSFNERILRKLQKS